MASSILRQAFLVLAVSVAAATPSVIATPAREVPIAEAATAPLRAAHRAELIRVIDGDTIEVRVSLWLDQSLVTKVRLRGIDAPEMTARCDQEARIAVAARDRLRDLASPRGLLLADVRPDKYAGRVVAAVTAADGTDLGATLLAEGLARPYRGRRVSWC
jgi:micrococcal nuclease